MDRNHRKTLLKALIKKMKELNLTETDDIGDILPNNKIQYLNPQDRQSPNYGYMTISEMAAGTPNIF